MRTKTHSNSHKYIVRLTVHPSVVSLRVCLIHNEQVYEISENKTGERVGIDSLRFGLGAKPNDGLCQHTPLHDMKNY